MRKLLAVLSTMALILPASAEGPFQATGLKVGEVTDTTAIVWARLTAKPKRNPESAPMVKIVGGRNNPTEVKYPKGITVADIRNAVPGAKGEVRALYRGQGEQKWLEAPWAPVDPAQDFTHQFLLKGLKANSRYQLQVEGRPIGSTKVSSTVQGGFRTAPSSDQVAKVVFTVSTGQAYNDKDLPTGYKIYPSMRKLDPSFFVHTGDIVYYDRLAKTAALARYHWQRTYSLPTNVRFHNHVSSYFIKDDHDTWQNDCWPSMKNKKMYQFTFVEGLGIFREQVPMGTKTYRTRRWGKDLQVWLVEGRDFRSPNRMPDGPTKTIWGKEQKEWFKKTVKESDATFRLLISPTPVVGPDRANKHDNHSNKDFTHEGDEIRKFLADQGMIVVCGDRHWQYVSVHPKTKVREYSCGPASNQHAGGWKKDDFRKDYHQYLNVTGGVLSVTAERQKGEPLLIFRHHDVNGKVLHEDVRKR